MRAALIVLSFFGPVTAVMSHQIGLGSMVMAAAPMSATDSTKVPHYFGPYPNWANSPQALPNAVVTITGDGTGAEASATVDPRTGGVSAVNVTNPGSGYTYAAVSIDSPGMQYTAAVAVAGLSTGAVSSVSVVEPGFGFVQPLAEVVDSSATPGTGARLSVSGGVDSLTLTSGGSGYAVRPTVHLSMPDRPGGVQATASADMDSNGVVTSITIVEPGSGYTAAPTVTILDGDTNMGATAATATATLGIVAIDVAAGGAHYQGPSTVVITDAADPAGVAAPDHGASATATLASDGAVTSISLVSGGSGYITPGLKKFVDTLPGLGKAGANDLGQYIPVAVPDTTTYPGTDYYEIGVVQYTMKFHRDLPATLLRGYVQLSTSVVPGDRVPLVNERVAPAGTDQPVLLPNGTRAYGVDKPHYLGPTIVATKDRPVRILFRNLLPTGEGGDLFLPVDTTVMGSGAGPDMMSLDANGVPVDMAMNAGSVTDEVRNPMCGMSPKPFGCYTDNRATLHLHGGITPWISDGTPHQWITPANESTPYPKGVSVSNVPDMEDPGPGAETFFYTNQQSARLMFYHDHSWGITRLNVYAGESAAYLITDDVEKGLFGAGAPFSDLGSGTPLVIQDKTFVPAEAALAQQDPTWDRARWGGEGSLWVPHVYMPAQNPSSPTGLSSFGRWHYGSWFWPPATNTKYGPIDNPYYDPTCDPATAAFCEPQQIPGTPNVSVGMEQFNDTPVVNGTAYPTTTVDPKAYRFRVLNAANDRFWNLQWYVADPSTGTLSEVALKPAEVAAAQTDPNVFPTPDTAKSPAGPNWIQIGTEGGFLPAPVVVPNQPTTWITDPSRFDVGNVDQHSLLLAPAERADVIVDFSQYRGKTLILYNDAPAAFPARVAGYDYYTGNPDLSPSGAPSTLAGYGPNTRTIMQVKVGSGLPTVAFDRPNTTSDRLGVLTAAFAHHLDSNGKPAGVFEKGQHPIIVGQAAYNGAYGSTFAGTGFCSSPKAPSAKCDGFARIQQQGGDLFKFDTLGGQQLGVRIEPKAIHDEVNSSSFDEYGRMSANLGVESPGATPLTQNITLLPYVNPATEVLSSDALPSSLQVSSISSGSDGTQIWKITHNGVDTHPIHFHLFDVQVINRVAWDGIIMPPEPTELGWKDTVRVSPLEDTIVAVRPIVPTLPFDIPDSRRPLNPMMPLGARGTEGGPLGSQAGFNNTNAQGNPIAPITNAVVNFGWEYTWHCHILSHEEMDMMRPMSVKVTALAPKPPSSVTSSRTAEAPRHVILRWTDGTPVDYTKPSTWGDRRGEIGYRIERAELTGDQVGPFTEVGTAPANATSFFDATSVQALSYVYRVTAWNEAGTASSDTLTVPGGATARVTLTPSTTRTVYGNVVRYTVQVSGTPGRAVPTGTVTLRVTNPGAPDLVLQSGLVKVGGVAATNWPTTALAAGTNTAIVTYSGDPTYLEASSAPVIVTVDARTTSTVVTPSKSTLAMGEPLTLNALVSGASGGTVTFTIDGVAGTPVPVAFGRASMNTSALLPGTHTVRAVYSGSANALPSTSAPISVQVNRAVTRTFLVATPASSLFGTAVQFTASVVVSAPATGMPSGTVTFRTDNGVVLAGAVPLSPTGKAVFTSTSLPRGTQQVTAVFAGGPVFAGSTSATILVSVR